MFGYHSVRKGEITIVASGCTVSPTMDSICLRACWSMVPIKDRYIYYEKVGDQFVGRSVTGIYFLTTEFGVSQVHWDWTDSSVGSKDEMLQFIEENFLIKTDVSSPTLELILFLFSCVCFHYTHLEMYIHKIHHLRASPIFIAAGRAKHLHKFALTIYPWTFTMYTPYFTGIPPHVILMSEMESLKDTFEQETRDIVHEMIN